MAEKNNGKKVSLDFDEARNLEPKERIAGLKVKGKAMPFGGSWSYDQVADELTLRESPTDMK